MASDGLSKRATTGKCHICQRRRCTVKYVKAVGERNHGYAVGYIWECIDHEECVKYAQDQLTKLSPDSGKYNAIRIGLDAGKMHEYSYFN